MSDAGDPTCWLHLACPDCGGIHTAHEPCQVAEPRRAVHVDAPGHGSRGIAATELNATVVVLDADGALGRATVDRDIAFTVVAGSGTLTTWSSVDGGAVEAELALAPGTVAIVPAGMQRAIRAGATGLTWSSVHRRRDGLGIGGAAHTAILPAR